MKIRVLGGGWFGCSLAQSFLADGHTVELHEIADRLFLGASGSNPARLHQGQHYPRSGSTRRACREHNAEFMATYGHLTRHVQTNIYAIAEQDSYIDFMTYLKVLKDEVDYLVSYNPAEYGLHHVEGAILTSERHIVIDDVRGHFAKTLRDIVKFGMPPGEVNSKEYDYTVDCTFCANDQTNIHRYEPCVTVLLKGPTDRAVTIMDGPFPSVYPWNEQLGLSSLTSALLTPIRKDCTTHAEAVSILKQQRPTDLFARGYAMLDQMFYFWPAVAKDYKIVDFKCGVRALPRSAADARLFDIVRVGDRAVRVRAGKIDSIFAAARALKAEMGI